MHYNIGKKEIVNPFANIKYISANENSTNAMFVSWLHKQAISVNVAKLNERFTILFDIELLNFETYVSWRDCGKFGTFTFGRNNTKVYFRLEDEIMYI